MFLPPRSDFPPEEWKYFYRKFMEWQAWYSGDPEQLMALYTSDIYFPNTDNGRFWKRIEAEERAGIVHLPAAGDVASTSADLLFSEPPVFKYKEKDSGGDRIKTFIKENGLYNLLLEAADIAAALSGVFLKIDIDPGLAKIPIVSTLTPLQAFPEFDRGRLREVLFFRTVREEKSGAIWRLFENRKRENGKLLIEYKLFKGKSDGVGDEYELGSINETAKLGLENIEYAVDGLGCVYVPNMRPNRLVPISAIGVNDYYGCITLMDSLDFAWTSWMRDIELGLGQLLVDEEILEDVSGTKKFNKFQKAFVKLNLSPYRITDKSKPDPITPVQFELRVEEHMKTCESLFFNIVTQCGYSPQTFGLGTEGRAESGTALRIRERKSLLTRGKKGRYWQPALWELFYQMQQLDSKSNLSTVYTPQEVDVVLEDSIIVDSLEQSETIRNLEQARAVSTYTKIKMLHPEWNEEDIKEETQRILDESEPVDLTGFGNTNKEDKYKENKESKKESKKE